MQNSFQPLLPSWPEKQRIDGPGKEASMTTGKTQGLAPIPVAVDRKVVARYVHASVAAAAAAGPRQVAGRLCYCLLGSCRHDCAVSDRVL